MKYFSVYLLLFCGFFLSCSSDCSKSDWIGTFTKISEDCANSTPIFSNSISIVNGSCHNCVSIILGDNLIFDGNCEATTDDSLFGEVIRTLQGSTLIVSIPLLECSTTYTKQ